MPLTHHDYTELRAGDDWAIQATLLNPDGTPFDLTNAQIEWILLGPDGSGAITSGYVVSIVNNPTSGQAVIQIGSALTQPLEVGYYMDSLRVISPAPPAPNGLLTTMWDGQIGVCINMFYPLYPPPVVTPALAQELRTVYYPDELTALVLPPPPPVSDWGWWGY
jgi:hypothetical protein